MKKILITGITGFAGSFLAEAVSAQSDTVISGTYISEKSLENVAAIKDKLDLVNVNLLDKDAVTALITEKKPDQIYHLAALTSPSDSLKNPSETVTNNITAQINVLEAVRLAQLSHTRIITIASGDMYGIVDSDKLPITEETPFHPTNPYAVSKIAQDYFGLQYFLAYKMPIIRLRPFNHIGPRHAPHFAIARFAKSIAEIEKGKAQPILKVGNLDAKRDYTDVKDMVRAYMLLMEKGEPGDVYNIGSGVSRRIGNILDMLLAMSSTKIRVEVDPLLLRPSDNPDMRANSMKMQKITGWKTEIPFEKTLESVLDYWREIV